ncbi:hypothetical protein QUF50_02575 [Thiotrichales bacterium HSG1]|nr:hypothetical protein [Thiotrichales bacterium HSG1]
MNKYLPLLFVLTLFGCNEDGVATIDVVKQRIGDQIQTLVGKGDIALQKYDNKIKKVKSDLIKVKVSHKTFEQKLQQKKNSLANLETDPQKNQQRIDLLKSTVQQMESLLLQIKNAEEKLQNAFVTLTNNRSLVKAKIETLQAKLDMMDAIRTVQEYNTFEGDLTNLGGDMESTFDSMQKEIYAMEAEIEVENLLNQADKL